MVSTNELKQLERIITDPNIDGDQHLATLPRGGNRQMTLLSDIKEELIMDGFMNNASGVFRCPTPDCNGQQFMNDPTKCERIICEQCNQTFGSMCLGPYHYKTSCEGVHELKRKYDYWKNEQRLPFMQQYRQDQSSNAEQLDEYNKRKLQLEKDQRVADAMKKAEEADELYKSKHCVSCPKCKRVIQHMGGCDGKLFFFFFQKAGQ